VVVLKIPELGTVEIGTALEWLFYVVLPNFCFSKALQDLVTRHQIAGICNQIDEKVPRTLFCAVMKAKNTTNPCCPGQLHDASAFLRYSVKIL